MIHARFPRPPLLPLLLLTPTLLLGGCTSQFAETHYFRSENEPANYYRLRVRGNVTLGSARYISGYFDEDAVNEYFNEMTQRDKGEFIRKPGSGDGTGTGSGTGGGSGTDTGTGNAGTGSGTNPDTAVARRDGDGVQVNYGTQQVPRIAVFDDCVEIEGEGGKPFSMPGDSGSVILEQDTGHPVALLFAGDGVHTTACELGPLCRRLRAWPI